MKSFFCSVKSVPYDNLWIADWFQTIRLPALLLFSYKPYSKNGTSLGALFLATFCLKRNKISIVVAYDTSHSWKKIFYSCRLASKWQRKGHSFPFFFPVQFQETSSLFSQHHLERIKEKKLPYFYTECLSLYAKHTDTSMVLKLLKGHCTLQKLDCCEGSTCVAWGCKSSACNFRVFTKTAATIVR